MSPGRVLGVDLGERRIGLALSDPLGILASPLSVLERTGDPAADHRAIVAAAREVGAARIVVGLPLTLAGEEGEQARETRAFVAQLAGRVDVPVDTYDERFTTVLADRERSRHEPDAVAAAHLLEGYLRRLAG